MACSKIGYSSLRGNKVILQIFMGGEVVMKRAKNDATLSKIGDVYQHYIALLDCFGMKQGDKLQIEVNGDISKIGNANTSSFQKEVKHHASNTNLSDRDIDFWKTLKNWVCDFERTNSFSELVLFTTADIAEDSVFFNWNKKTISEKYGIIKAIGDVNKAREDVFRGLYNEIEAKRDIEYLKWIFQMNSFHIQYRITSPYFVY